MKTSVVAWLRRPSAKFRTSLRIALDGDEAVGVTDAFIVRFLRSLVAFLLLDESPNFIALDILHRNVHDQTAHEASRTSHQPSLSIFMMRVLSRPVIRWCSDRVSFHQGVASAQSDLLFGDVDLAQRERVRFGVGLAAVRAPEPPQPITVLPEA